MTIEHASNIDGIGLDKSKGEVVLLISDHLSWEESSHVSALKKKIDAYLKFISSQQHIDRLPEASGWPVRIKLVHEHVPTMPAEAVLNAVKKQLGEMKIRFSHESLPAGY